MPNLLLTDFCNRNCPYCFAKDKLNRSSKDHHLLSYDQLIQVLDFLDRSGVKNLNLLGGEPTLHPQFSLFLRYILGRGFFPHIFTNGMIPGKTLEEVLKLLDDFGRPAKEMRFIVNINEPHLRTREENRKQNKTLAQLHDNISLSFNIYRPDHDLTFLLETINRFKTTRYIRFGLAQPVIGKSNEYLPINAYPKIVQNLMHFVEQSDSEDVSFGMDCGFTLCLFNDEQLGRLYRARTKIAFTCGPPIDIGRNLDVWYCFPLSNTKNLRLTDFEHLDALVDALNAQYEQDLFHRGIYPKCASCLYLKRRVCMGGCMGHYYSGQNTTFPVEI